MRIIASVCKFKKAEVGAQIKHVERTAQSIEGADRELIDMDYLLTPVRDMDSYDYFAKRLSDVYCFKRKDVIVLHGWVVTVPRELSRYDHSLFFSVAYQFFAEKYGTENIVTAAVHYDEGGSPHLHVLAIPVIPFFHAKHIQTERVQSRETLNK